MQATGLPVAMGQSHPQAPGELGVDFIPHCYTDNLESGCSSYKPLDAYESSYGATDFGKKRKRKRRKKARGRRRATARLLFRKRGMLGFDFLSLQLIPDRSVQIHDFWHCCCSMDKMTYSSSNGCLVTVQTLLGSGRLVPSCILKVY